jgi:hypothetical protein
LLHGSKRAVADDIVSDLRFHIGAVQSSWDVTLYMRAADRIEAQDAEIERLRAAGDALCAALRLWIEGTHAFTDDEVAVAAWMEARRG